MADSTRNQIIDALEARFVEIKPNLEERDNDHSIYGGSRTSPYRVAVRVANKIDSTVESIAAGNVDDIIEAVWHDRADAEHWYRYEKQWV